MYSAHNDGKSLIDVMFIKRLKTKIYKKMTANNSKSDLSYLNKLVDQYNSLYHHYFNKKAIKADFSALDEKIETSHKSSKFNGNDRVGITKHNKIVSNSYIENWSMERFIVNSVLKTIP